MAASRPPIPSYLGALAQLNKARGKAAAKKLPRPLVLANRVSNRRLRQGEATCITEMSLMMACWKQNEFSDTACAQEIQMFYDCAAKAEAERKEKIRQESIGLTGNLTPKQVNKLLSRFPNITQNS
uniref:Coiled-coil-helix-coiled-coil-helix domain containing 1 n=1 Tax=Anolis carolinensis TaxID=28377 RepID=A0A803T2G7_ANOCA|nr:PREDICTED: coiled-coil-helix-coiled-coil-helix domain-containing protein 1 [Anolis carolinensis]|eukprot:XP_008112460.1 PREDICTED: coiled-coil-helix-coiled-coil-helix domain-containing protein 1 [Anolis carolinensis]